MKSINSPKKVLITGASSGIGLATAHVFASRKYDLVLTSFPGDKRLKGAAQNIFDRYGVTAQELYFDMANDSQCREITKQDVFGEIDILINNAGVGTGLISLMDDDPVEWSRMIDTNVKGALHMTKAVSPGMLSRNSGDIVLLGSILSRYAARAEGAYASTKAAIYALGEGMRMDFFKTNLRVTVIEPGLVQTRAAHHYKGMTPLQPIDVARSIYWAVTRPAHLNIFEIVLTGKDQYSSSLVNRKSQ